MELDLASSSDKPMASSSDNLTSDSAPDPVPGSCSSSGAADSPASVSFSFKSSSWVTRSFVCSLRRAARTLNLSFCWS